MLAVAEVLNQTSPQLYLTSKVVILLFQNLITVGSVRLKSEETAPNRKNFMPLGISW
jgi:hypothetical protein